MFGRRDTKDPTKLLKLHSNDWRQGELLRVTPRRRWDTDPTATRMVIRRHDAGEFALAPMRWGLTPERHTDEEKLRPLITVRAETLAGHIEWRRLLNARRCVVPADQFFEWMRVNGVRTREYGFKLKSRRPMMIAALWNRTVSPTGTPADAFAYISCQANRLVSLVHDRMPVILDDASMAAWFDPDATLEDLLALLKPCDASLLDCQLAGETARPKPHQPSLFASAA